MKYKLGIGIPYYVNGKICEWLFKYLMQIIDFQLTDEVKLVIYEDGQHSLWLEDYNKSNIIKIRKENQGLGHARNMIIDECNDCKYILFIDSDDRIDSNYIEEVLKAIKEDNYSTDVFMSNFYINNSKFERDGIKNHCTGMIYKRDFIKNIRFNENRNFGEDMEFNEEVRKLNPSLKYIDTNYYYNFGINNNCISYKYARDEITEFKEGSDV